MLENLFGSLRLRFVSASAVRRERKAPRLKPDVFSGPKDPAHISSEQDVARVDRGSVAERDDLFVGVKAGVDLPLAGRADLDE